jgi:hypothetical protein
VLVSGENARLRELIALFGCGNEIAPIDTDGFRRRAGELIAAAISGSQHPKRQPKQGPEEARLQGLGTRKSKSMR